jgi:hypothetical protein
MIKIYQVTHFTYTARTDGSQNGMVKDYEVYLSTDGKTWGSPVLTGTFKNTTSMQVAALKEPTPGRYLKFIAKSEINGNAWTSASEIGIQATADVTAIDAISTEQAALFPFTDAYYTLQGIPVKTPTHGSIYIHKGKKIIK